MPLTSWGPGAPRLYAKLERFNPSGSAKDRPAASILAQALASGRLAPGGTLVESSSGNLGVALAQQARWHGVRLICVVDPRTNRCAQRAMRALGAVVVCVEEPDEQTGDWLTARIARVQEIVASTPGAYWSDQYANEANPAAHASGTMREIAEDLDHRVSAVYVAVSTTGTLNGCLDYARAHSLGTDVIAVDAVGSVLFGGTHLPRRLPGIGAGMVPPLALRAQPADVLRVEEYDAVLGCRFLAAHEGLLVGASGGAVVAAVRETLDRYGPEDRVVLVFHDGGEPYLDTVYDDDWVAERFGVAPDPGALDMPPVAAVS